MSALERHVAALAHALGAAPFDAARVRIVALGPRDFDGRGRPLVEEGALQTIESFAARFDAVLASGYAWVNLSYVGRLGDRDLVAIEVPGTGASAAVETAVNYSGPPQAVVDAGGDASAWIARRAPGGRS